MKIYLTSTFANVVQDFIKKFGLIPQHTKVAFIANASDPYPDHPWTQVDKDSLLTNGFEIEDIDIRTTYGNELKEKLHGVDVIFLAGGNTSYLFQAARESGLNEMVRDLRSTNKIHVGSSAGSILAGPSVEPFYKSDMAELKEFGCDIHLADFHGIGLVDFVVLPHVNKESHRKEFEEEIIPKYSDRFEFKMLTDDQAIAVDT